MEVKESGISVVIPLKNDENRIGDCLSAVFSQSLAPLEVLIIDGHSTDRSLDYAKKFPVKTIFEDYGTVGGARQVGLEHARGSFIAFTDSDCVPDFKWLEILFNNFQDGIVGVGGGIKNIGTGIWEESIGLALDSFLGSANSIQDRVLKTKKYVHSISGCNSLYRTEDLLKVGGYNTTYFMNEDTDINKRLLEMGKLLYVPEALVYHNQNRNLKKFCKRMFWFGYGRGYNRLYDLQVIPPISILLLIPLFFFAPALAIYLIILYILVVMIFTLSILMRINKITYFLTIPVVFFMEHIWYTIGFWSGTIKRIIQPRLR